MDDKPISSEDVSDVYEAQELALSSESDPCPRDSTLCVTESNLSLTPGGKIDDTGGQQDHVSLSAMEADEAQLEMASIMQDIDRISGITDHAGSFNDPGSTTTMEMEGIQENAVVPQSTDGRVNSEERIASSEESVPLNSDVCETYANEHEDIVTCKEVSNSGEENSTSGRTNGQEEIIGSMIQSEGKVDGDDIEPVGSQLEEPASRMQQNDQMIEVGEDPNRNEAAASGNIDQSQENVSSAADDANYAELKEVEPLIGLIGSLASVEGTDMEVVEGKEMPTHDQTQNNPVSSSEGDNISEEVIMASPNFTEDKDAGPAVEKANFSSPVHDKGLSENCESGLGSDTKDTAAGVSTDTKENEAKLDSVFVIAPDDSSKTAPIDTTLSRPVIEVVPAENETSKEGGLDNLQISSVLGSVVLTTDEQATSEPSKDAAAEVANANSGGENIDFSKSQEMETCLVCHKVMKCKYNVVRNGDIKHLCDVECFKSFRASPSKYLSGLPVVEGEICSYCGLSLGSKKDEFTITTKEGIKKFCKRSCMLQQCIIQKICPCCKTVYKSSIPYTAVIEQQRVGFCNKRCLVAFTKSGQDDDDDEVQIVGTSKAPQDSPATKKRQKCAVCKKKNAVEYEITTAGKINKLCSSACFEAFRYANKLDIQVCEQCKKQISARSSCKQSIPFEGKTLSFCSRKCVGNFKNMKQRLVVCGWCGATKINFDMIERVDFNKKYQHFCSLNCLSLYRVNLQATSSNEVVCNQCSKKTPAQYHLTMSDASVCNFCSYKCVMEFQEKFSQPRVAQETAAKNSSSTVRPKAIDKSVTRKSARAAARTSQALAGMDGPLIANVQSLAAPSPEMPVKAVLPTSAKSVLNTVPTTPCAAPASASETVGAQSLSTVTTSEKVVTKVIVQPQAPKSVKNKSILCKPFVQTKATSCKPHQVSIGTMTDEELIEKPALIPVPVPIYVPLPMRMYSEPVPYPLPIPIPIPVPVFIPTTRKSANGILKHIKEIQERTPADPFEAELLAMADSLARDGQNSSSDSEAEEEPKVVVQEEQPIQQQNELGEDMLQMALRMASEMPDEPLMDVEDSIQTAPINPEAPPPPPVTHYSTIDQDSEILHMGRETRSRGRGKRKGGSPVSSTPRTRQKKAKPEPVVEPEIVQQPPVAPADANMVLKFTYGVNAWKHWVVQKNAQIDKGDASVTRKGRQKQFKTDLLQCTADELNFSLCLFVREVRKPNGEEYAPDSIFYLCLGIQQYLLENGRIDNIFSDIYYEPFTEHLNTILEKYEVRLNTQGLIVCRIEEEHLWESKQLGAHSPYVLLNTLIYFNTKCFMLKTPEEHLRLSFSHIMKHWKKTTQPGMKTPGRSVYLRYYAPVPTTPGEPRKKREEMPVFEQAENTENPLRCPVKLYEFYLSKCPESIKNRNDVFYLVPERSCVPDSPVWYSTGQLEIGTMTKMLNRLRVVREIQESHLHYQPAFFN